MSDDSTIKFWDINEKQELYTLKGHKSLITSAALMKNGAIITCSHDKSIRFWSEY